MYGVGITALIKGHGVQIPSWVLSDGWYYYLPSRNYLVSLAGLRAEVCLTTSDVVDQVCPPKKKCYDREVAREAKRVMDRVYDILSGWSRELIREAPTPRVEREWREWIDRALSEVGKLIDGFRPEPTMCKVIEALGCYVDKPKPSIYIAMDRLEDLAQEIEGRIGKKWDQYEKDRLRRELLRSIITHEMTHSFTHACSGVSPSRTISDEFTYEVIEESLATYIGFKHFDYGEGVNEVYKHKIIYEEPLEYSVFWVWDYLGKTIDVDSILGLWAGLGVKDYTYLLWALTLLNRKLLIPMLLPIHDPRVRHILRRLIWVVDVDELLWLVRRYPWILLLTAPPFTWIMIIEKLGSERIWKLLAMTIATYALKRA